MIYCPLCSKLLLTTNVFDTEDDISDNTSYFCNTRVNFYKSRFFSDYHYESNYDSYDEKFDEKHRIIKVNLPPFQLVAVNNKCTIYLIEEQSQNVIYEGKPLPIDKNLPNRLNNLKSLI